MSLNYPSPAFDAAVAAVCHGTASEEQLQALNRLLRDESTARDEYLLRVELHARLASDPDLFAGASRDIPPIPAADTAIPFPALPRTKPTGASI